MTDEQESREIRPNPRFLPEWVRDQVEAWLAEELRAHLGDRDAATVAVLERVKGDPRMVRAVGDAWGRGVLLEGMLRRGQTPADVVTPLVAQLDQLREELSGGRTFPCAAEVIREIRGEHEVPQ